MNKNLRVVWLLILYCSVLFVGFSAENVMAEKAKKISVEVTDRVENDLPTGWINSVSSDSIIIDDSYYVLTKETQYPDGKGKLKEGVFVEFESRKENIIDKIAVAEPQEDDMYMKPIIRGNDALQETPSGGSGGGNKPRLENGVWVN